MEFVRKSQYILRLPFELWPRAVVHINPSVLSQERLVDSSRPVMSWSSWPAGAQDPVTPTPCVSSRCRKHHRTVTHSSAVHTSLPPAPPPSPAGFQTADWCHHRSLAPPTQASGPSSSLRRCSHFTFFSFPVSVAHVPTIISCLSTVVFLIKAELSVCLSVCMPGEAQRRVVSEQTPETNLITVPEWRRARVTLVVFVFFVVSLSVRFICTMSVHTPNVTFCVALDLETRLCGMRHPMCYSIYFFEMLTLGCPAHFSCVWVE